jgi:hypothetical protein
LATDILLKTEYRTDGIDHLGYGYFIENWVSNVKGNGRDNWGLMIGPAVTKLAPWLKFEATESRYALSQAFSTNSIFQIWERFSLLI